MAAVFKTLLISIWLATLAAFAPSSINSARHHLAAAKIRESSTKLDLFLAPQIGFAALCAGAVFAYVFNNIDSIKETQKVSIDKAMADQSSALRSAEAGQKAALEKVKAQTDANLNRAKQIAADAKQRAEDIGKAAAGRK